MKFTASGLDRNGLLQKLSKCFKNLSMTGKTSRQSKSSRQS
jgi:hypothetical protein